MDYRGGYSNAGTATSAAPYLGPKDPVVDSGSPIRDSMSATEQILSDLHNTIDQLEKRLDTVLMPTPPSSGTTTKAQDQPVTSHVRGRLLILNDGYNHATARLRDLMLRVEV